MDNIGLQPPQPPIVTVEEPQIIKPRGKFGQTMRKHGLKFLMGGLLTLLLGAGVWLEVQVVQQKQQVESQATVDEPCHVCVGGECRAVNQQGGAGWTCNSNLDMCTDDTGCEGELNETLPPVCQSTSISSNTLSPGGSLTITSTATTADITGFLYGFYNRDNPYGPDNPKPIWFVSNTDYTHAETVPPTNSHTTTVTYDELNRPDLNWGGQKPTKIQVNAFFGNSAGSTHSDANCVEQFELTIPRPDYCVSASADPTTMNLGDNLALSSVSNTQVNGFFWVAYNLDNLYGPSNPKPVCTGTGSKPDECPNGGTPLIFSDPNNSSTAGQGLRTNGSTYVPYVDLFVTDKNTGQQVKNLQFNAYFSLNGGQWSWPQPNCVAYTKMATASPPPNPTISCTGLTSDVAAPVVGQSVTGTCHGSFSSVAAPVARFGVSINGGEFMRSEIIPLNAAGTANYTVTVPMEGNYVVQCQICTDATGATCTTWGQAN